MLEENTMKYHDNHQGNKNNNIYPVLSLAAPVIGVIVSVILSVYLTGELNRELWLKQDVSNQKKILVEKRIQLIERASKLINSREIIEDINIHIKFQADFTSEASNCFDHPERYNATVIDCKKLLDLNETFKKLKLKNEIIGEFGAVIQLTSLYFGEKTAKYSAELSRLPKWWLADNTLYLNYISAMHEDLYYYK